MRQEAATQFDEQLEFAADIAMEAGRQTLALFRSSSLGVERKSDGSPVTIADRQAEQLLRERISDRYPDDAILGEEFAEKSGTSGYRWVLDPIDGTKSFVSGVPLYTTLVAMLEGDQPKLGVIYSPGTDEIVYAQVGGGCWYRLHGSTPLPAHVSTVANLADAVFVTSEVRTFTTERPVDARKIYDKLQDACWLTRTWGDAYGYLLVATGRVDIAVDPAMNLWDAAALQTIIEEAGGTFTDWQGNPTVHSADSMAANPQLADKVLQILQG